MADGPLLNFAQRASQSKNLFEFVALAVTHQGCRQCRSIQGASYILSSIIAMWAARGTLHAIITIAFWAVVFFAWWLWVALYADAHAPGDINPADSIDLTQFDNTDQQ